MKKNNIFYVLRFPQSTPCVQLSVLNKSYMTTHQFSPVEHLNNKTIAELKSEKLLYSSITSPFVTDLKRKTPKTEYMKKTSSKRVPTFIREGKETIRASNSFCKPLY